MTLRKGIAVHGATSSRRSVEKRLLLMIKRRERHIQKIRAEQARNREVNQKRMEEEAARRYAEEELCREAREAER